MLNKIKIKIYTDIKILIKIHKILILNTYLKIDNYFMQLSISLLYLIN